MPLVSASDPLVLEVGRLRRQAAYHKREMYRHKEDLRRTKTELAGLEAQCQARGLPLESSHPPAGEGGIHGHDDDTPRS